MGCDDLSSKKPVLLTLFTLAAAIVFWPIALLVLLIKLLYPLLKNGRQAPEKAASNQDANYKPMIATLRPKTVEQGDNHLTGDHGKESYTLVLDNRKVEIRHKKWRNQCKSEFVAIDIETTGLDAINDKIIEVSAVRYRNLVQTEQYTTLIKPDIHISSRITKINGITDDMVKDAPRIDRVLPELLTFIGDSILVAHNAVFDLRFLKRNSDAQGLQFTNSYIDTLPTCRNLFPEYENHKLPTILKNLNISVDRSHRALDDTIAVGQVLLECIKLYDIMDEVKAKQKAQNKAVQ